MTNERQILALIGAIMRKQNLDKITVSLGEMAEINPDNVMLYQMNDPPGFIIVRRPQSGPNQGNPK